MIEDLIKEDEIEQWAEEDSESSTTSTDYSDLKSLRVIRSNQDYNLDNLFQSINKNINLGPDYQRRARWSTKQKSRLIESFLMNIPVPPIFLYENDYYEYEVIDGRQRLEAIHDFISNKFKLNGLEFLTHLKGTRFSALDDESKRLLYRRTITATILLVESNTFDKYDLRMILFNRLNTGGEKLNGQELRNAIYAGKFNDLIHNLSKNKKFNQLWGIPIDNDRKIKNPIYKTMMDCELVLRFFAIKDAYSSDLDGSMKKLLDNTMKQYQNTEDHILKEMALDFEQSVEGLVDNIGLESIKNPLLEMPRRARNLYDSMLVAYSLINKEKIKDRDTVLTNLITVLSKDDIYEKIITKGNSLENIKFRIDTAKSVLTMKI